MNEDIKFLDEIMSLRNKKDVKDRKFFWIYPFTNENIKAYYRKIDFEDKDVLCVTSSGDHALNAILAGANGVSAFDINPLAKYFVELKIAAIKTLSLEEFILFFYDKKLFTYKYFLNKKIYNKFRYNLIGEYKEFWDYFFDNYTKRQVFISYLFSDDYLSLKALVEVNSYLNEENYYHLREILKKININYYDLSLKDLNTINKKFDIVLLSNVSSFLKYVYEKDLLKNLKESISSVSKENTKVVVNYFYDNLLKGDFKDTIYDKELVSKYFNEEEYHYEAFRSSHDLQLIDGFRILSDNYDQVLIKK